MNRSTLPLVLILLTASFLPACKPPSGSLNRAAPAASGGGSAAGTSAVQPTGDIAVCFSPKGGCTEVIVREIDAAGKSIWVQAYRLTSVPIAQAMVRARERGLDVRVILDKSTDNAKYSDATFFANKGVKPLIDKRHAIAHNKVMVIDGATVITGSFNFTEAAEESNAENLLVIKGRAELAEKYAENFLIHEKHSEAYLRSGPPAKRRLPSGANTRRR